MSIDNAMDRLRAANPAPDKRLLRAELDDLNVLLSATWQRSTNVQTKPSQETQQSEKPTRRGTLVAAAAFAVVAVVGVVAILIATNNDRTPAVLPAGPTTTEVVLPAGPITIEYKLDVSTQPIVGTFEVTEGSDILGCSAGTFVDDAGFPDVNRVTTCSGPNTGNFIIAFDPEGYDTGPGDQNGPWRVVDGVADFTGLQGGGDWAGFGPEPQVGIIETITGNIEFTP